MNRKAAINTGKMQPMKSKFIITIPYRYPSPARPIMSLAPMSETTSDMPAAHQGKDLPAKKKSRPPRISRPNHTPRIVIPTR